MVIGESGWQQIEDNESVPQRLYCAITNNEPVNPLLTDLQGMMQPLKLFFGENAVVRDALDLG